VENVIALAVQDMHSSCSETPWRADSRDRLVINAVPSSTVQGTTLPSAAFAIALGYGRTQTDDTTKALSSGYLTWSPPV
jgi:hypothetical protein